VDLNDDRFFGRSETIVGAGLENIVQFGLGFIPGAKVVSLLGKVTAVSKGATAVSAVKGGRFILAASEGLVAGAVADFTAFEGHEKNFSAMVESIPALKNPLTEFLATDEEDPDIVGRVKNVLEGVGMGAALGLVIEGIRGLKAVRKTRKVETTAEELRLAQTGAVDPGRLNDGLRDATGIKRDLSPPSPKDPQPVTAKTHLADTPEGKKSLAESIAGVEDAQKLLDAFENSKATRKDPRGNPRKMTAAERVKRGLDENNKNIENLILTKGGAHAFRSLEDLAVVYTKHGEVPTQELVEKATLQAAAVNGIDHESYVQLLGLKLKGSTDSIREGMGHAIAAATYGKASMDALAKKMVVFKNLPMDSKKRGEVLQEIVRLTSDTPLQQDLADFGTALGQGLEAQKRKVAEGGLLAEISAEIMTRKAGDPKQLDAYFYKLSKALGDGKTGADLARAKELVDMGVGRQVMTATGELFINSILSGVKTLVIQPLSGFSIMVYKPLENMVGGIATGNRDIIRRSMFELESLWGAIGDSAKVAWKTLKEDQNFADPGNALRDDAFSSFRAGSFGTDASGPMGPALDFLGKFINVPTRLIKSADEFTKQLAARSVIRADALVEATMKGLPDPGKFADQRLRKIVVEGQLSQEALARQKAIVAGRKLGFHGAELRTFTDENYLDHFDDGLTKSMERALDVAREVTLQTPLEAGSVAAKGQEFLNSHPLLRFVVPFYRTPVNIAKFAGQRLGFASAIQGKLSSDILGAGPALKATQSRYLQDIMSGDPNRKAEAVGRFATGVGLLSGASMLAFSGQITGRGPSDPARRKAMIDAGWQPYSFKTANGYVQFLRMDPLATFFGLAADYADTIRMQGEDDDEDGHSHTMALMTAFATNFTQKSFLQGIGQVIDAFSDPEKNMSALVEQYAGAIVPNTLAQAVGLFGDDNMKEAHSIGEKLRGRVPGLSDTATPRRNLLGETIEVVPGEDPVATWISTFVPIAYREVSSDTIRIELFNLKHGFNPPKARILGLDLRQVREAGQQSAHDRWSQLHGEVKVNGKTLRQELSTLIRSTNYRKLDPEPSIEGPSPRVNLINAVVGRYRSKAFDAMLKEYPALRAEIRNREVAKVGRKRGLAAIQGISTQIGNFPTN
jgi:hypothetical protein